MEFRILGPLEVVSGDVPVSLGGPKPRMVLVHLLLRAKHLVSFEQLIDDVWGDNPPPAARNSLQTYVSHLRKAVGPDRLEGGPHGYVLHAAAEEIDVARFETLLREARRLASSNAADAAATFQRALALWRGPALDGLAHQPSLRAEAARLEELRMAAVEERIEAELALGHQDELVPELTTLVARHPFRERLWQHLMLTLYRSGRQKDALEAFHQARDILAEELGLDPSSELQQLHDRILRHDSELQFEGRPLRGYRLLDPLGEGAFGAVHRAFQAQVGREVAVKIVHARLADDPEFVRRFEAEAQLIARLEHPHIVPLYDFWREPGAAYLVMPYLRGGSLRKAIAHEPLAPADVARVLDHVALALSSAHRQGTVHRNVKPANVLFDEDGNAYLSDFAIAKELAASQFGEGPGGSGELAYYLSPEEIRGEPVTPRADIYGLGLLLFEALEARHPFGDGTPEEVLERHLSELPPPLVSPPSHLREAMDAVIKRAAAKDPERRYGDAADVAAAFRAALAPRGGRVSLPQARPRNPYKGLRPFAEADAADFFGRESLVSELLARLHERGEGERFLAVVGPSGSGKSSVVMAGLIPAIRLGALAGATPTLVIEMHPGAHPFEELAAALTRVAVHSPPDLVGQLEGDDEGLVSAASAVLPEGSELVLVIDQFEELFTLCDNEEGRQSFLRLLHCAVTHPRSTVRVVVTLRADLYDRPLSYPALAELVKQRTVIVTPLTPGELERAVSRPAERVGVKVEPALLSEIGAAVADQPGALPLLQYALTELFDHSKGMLLTLEAYREIRGVSGALGRRAEELYGRLNPAGKETARQLFLRLVTLGDGVREDARKRVLRAELTSLEVDSAGIERVIDTFGARRLLSFDRDPVTRGPTVEVAHEALLWEWTRLRGWIEGAREHMRARARLSAAVREWIESGRDIGYLLRGARLERFQAWAPGSGLALSAEERDYLHASLSQREAERAEEAARAERERALERRSLMRLRALMVALAAAALVATGLTLFAFGQRGRAEQEASRAAAEARVAAARELAAAAVANLDVDPERSILLALEAVDATLVEDGFVVREAEEALHRAVKESRLVRTVPQGGYGLAVTSDGTRFVTTGTGRGDDSATVWDTATGESSVVISAGGTAIVGVAFSPDDRRLATTHDDGKVRLWETSSGEQLSVLSAASRSLGHPAFSPDGRWLAVGDSSGAIRLWDVASGIQIRTLSGHTATVESVTFSPDGSRLASVSDDRTVRIWDTETGESIGLPRYKRRVSDVAFTPDGSRLATAGWDTLVRMWNAKSGARLRTFAGLTPLYALDFSPDGMSMATVGTDGIARVWNFISGRELLSVAGHKGGGAVNVAFARGGNALLTSGTDNTTRLWDISVTGGRDWLTVPTTRRIFPGVAFSPDGTRFAAPADRHGVAIWDVRTGEELMTLRGHKHELTTVAFSPDGARIAAASDATETPPIWDVTTGELLFTLKGHRETVRAVAFSSDGSRVITGSWDDTARVWDAATGKQVGVLRAGRDILAAGFSHDGRFIVTGGQDGSVMLWDASTRERMRSFAGHTGDVVGLDFGPEDMFITGSEDGTAKIWNLQSGEEILTLRGHTGFVNHVAMTSDGTKVATASDDRTAKLWDAATGDLLLTLYGHDDLVFGIDFSPDGRLLATASLRGTAALHLLPIDEFLHLARQRVTREMTDEECRRYVHLQTCSY